MVLTHIGWAYYEQTKEFDMHFFIFTYKKEASFFTCYEEMLKVNDFGLTRYNGWRVCGLFLTGPESRSVFEEARSLEVSTPARGSSHYI